jgi:ABC-2 type transport system permease protein
MFARIYALIIKEFLAVLKDPKIRITILLPPVLQLFIFTQAATLDVRNVPVGILNRDSGEKSFELTERFQGTPFFSRIAYLKSEEEIKPFLDEQKGVMVISFDETFSRNLDQKKPSTVQLLLDGRKSNTAQILLEYVSTIIEQYNENISAEAKIKQENTKIFPRFWFNSNLLFTWYNIPCLVATLSMITCLVVVTQSICREKELGTFDQLLVSPLLPLDIVIGKIVPGILIGMFEGTCLLIAGLLVYQIPFTGSILLFFLAQFFFVAAISGVGLFISALSSTQQQGMLGTFFFVVPSILLSGFATPVENMPVWLQPVSDFMPLKYMLIVSKGLFLKAMPFHIVFSNVWPMALIAFFTVTGAGIFFKKRLQ